MNFVVTDGETIIRTGIAGPASIAVIREKCEAAGHEFHEIEPGTLISGTQHWWDASAGEEGEFVERAPFPVAAVQTIRVGETLSLTLPPGTTVHCDGDADVVGDMPYERVFDEPAVYHLALRHHRYVNMNFMCEVEPVPQGVEE
jgi:hypothetical protein